MVGYEIDSKSFQFECNILHSFDGSLFYKPFTTRLCPTCLFQKHMTSLRFVHMQFVSVGICYQDLGSFYALARLNVSKALASTSKY
jgi:hypothetical protein